MKINDYSNEAIFEYLPDTYLYNAVYLTTKEMAFGSVFVLQFDDFWDELIQKVDEMVGIILFDFFNLKITDYVDKSPIEKAAFITSHEITGYYQYANNIKTDLQKYFNKNKDQITEFGYSENDFLAFCMIESYKIIRNRIKSSKANKSFILHEFTNNERNTNLKLYFSLRAFIQSQELIKLLNANFNPYLNSYFIDYGLILLKENTNFARQLNSDFIVALNDSTLTYGLDFSNSFNGISFDEPCAGTFWYYDKKDESFYSADRLTTSMSRPPLQNLYAVSQLNLKYLKINP